ncbi:MAG TPA: isochorismatase family protein, partial [Gemmatimonas sp.]|nr:isochorismatase family protein [Gemmatimonas sp.]
PKFTPTALVVGAADHGPPLTPSEAALLLIDHQSALLLSVQTQSAEEMRNNALALAKVGRLYDLPTVFTTSGAAGPNGPLLPGMRALHPDAPVIDRTLFFDAMTDPAFAGAVERTGRRQLIMAGITTDYCLALPAITARRLGYDVWAVIDASGAWSRVIEDVAVTRMAQHGVHVVTWAVVLAELQSNLAVRDADAALAKQRDVVSLLSERVAAIDYMITTFTTHGTAVLP